MTNQNADTSPRSCVQGTPVVRAKGAARAGTDLKVAVVGCGRIASIQIPYIVGLVGRRNLALCDSNKAKAAYLAETFGVPRHYGELSEMLHEFSPDVVHILTPPETHREVALMCIRRGSHVFVEKPFVLDPAHAREIVDCAGEHERLVCVDLMRMCDPLVTAAARLLESGELGFVVAVFTEECDNYIARRRAGQVPRWIRDLPGEIISDLLPHHLSLMRRFLPGGQLVSVADTRDDAGAVRQVTCLFKSSAGIGSTYISLDVQQPTNSVTLRCSRGEIVIDFANARLVVQGPSRLPAALNKVYRAVKLGSAILFSTFRNSVSYLAGTLDPYAGIRFTIESFYDAVHLRTPAPVALDQAVAVVEQTSQIIRQLGPQQAIAETVERTGVKPISSKPAVLVTGGSGFIGRVLVEKLLQRGLDVRVLSRTPEVLSRSLATRRGLSVIGGDVTNREDVGRACDGVGTVYHLAAATAGPWTAHFDVTVGGTENVLAAVTEAHVRRLVYVSTLSVLNASAYPGNGTVVDEDFPSESNPRMRGYYPLAKLEAEKLVKGFAANAADTSVVILRPGLVYGPGRDLLAQLAVRRGRCVFVLGSLDKVVPLAYVDNVAEALVLAGSSNATGTFNVVDVERVKVRDVIRRFQDVTGQTLFAVPIPEALITGAAGILEAALGTRSPNVGYRLKCAAKSVVHSSQRAARELNWKSATSFWDREREAMGLPSGPQV